MFDRDDRIGTARQHAPGRDRGRSAGPDFELRFDTGRNRLGVESQPYRPRLRRPEAVLGSQREAVEVGAVEGGHVDSGRHVLGQHPAQRGIDRNDLGSERHKLERRVPAQLGRVAVENFQELLLLHDPAVPGASSGNSSS